MTAVAPDSLECQAALGMRVIKMEHMAGALEEELALYGAHWYADGYPTEHLRAMMGAAREWARLARHNLAVRGR